MLERYIVFEPVDRDSGIGDAIDFKQGTGYKGRIRVESLDTLFILFHAASQARARQDIDQDAVGIQAVWILPKQFRANFSRFHLHPGAKIGPRQQNFHVITGWVFGQHRFDFDNRLLILPPFGVHLGQRAARQADFRRLQAITTPIQTAQFVLHAGIGWGNFVGPLHVPDCSVQIPLLISYNTHAKMRDKIIRHSQQYTLENIGGIRKAARFQIRLAQQAINFEIFWKCL